MSLGLAHQFDEHFALTSALTAKASHDFLEVLLQGLSLRTQRGGADSLSNLHDEVVYGNRAANSELLKTRYDQSIFHMIGGADHEIRPDFLSVRL